jgi:hypothetical protein
MRNENQPTQPSPEQPPMAPYDPPEPAPQAAAWRRALKVIGNTPAREMRIAKSHLVKTTVRRSGGHHA